MNQQDAQGRGPLHHATMLGHTGFVSIFLYHLKVIMNFKQCDASQIMFCLYCRQVCLFLKRGANQNAVDIDEKTPLTIAVEAANADIVTL